MDQEDIKWSQRAKQNWFKEGDRNTKFFHAYASQRQKKNTIHNIFDAANREHTEEPEIATAFRNYFEQLYTSSSPSHCDIEDCTKFLEPRIKNLMARDLTALLQERRWD